MNNYPFTIHDLRASVRRMLSERMYCAKEITDAVKDECWHWLEQRRMDVDEIRRDKVAETHHE